MGIAMVMDKVKKHLAKELPEYDIYITILSPQLSWHILSQSHFLIVSICFKCHCPGINLEWAWTGSATTTSCCSERSMRLGTWKPLLLKRWATWRKSSRTLSHGGVLSVLFGMSVRFLCKQALGFCNKLEANFLASGRPRAAHWQKGLN